MADLSIRAKIVDRRTYRRPIGESETEFETEAQHFDRVIQHQRHLWRRAKAGMIREEGNIWKLADLDLAEEAELAELRHLLVERKLRLSGRTHWLGGTSTVWKREIANFNCAALNLKRPGDYVDHFWLLLNGAGVGARPVPKAGHLKGFPHVIPEIEVIPSLRAKNDGGVSKNKETFDPATGVWHVKVGDSAEAWAKFLGKLLSKKIKATKLILDYSELRGAGGRLKGYGWLCCGWEPLGTAIGHIVDIMNQAAGRKLTQLECIDIGNLLGTVLSTRRAAEIMIVDADSDEAAAFAVMKKDYWRPDINKPWRGQSNNSLGFWKKPSRFELAGIFQMLMESGGSEPGFYNFEAANKRASYYVDMTNPCGEILLSGDGTLCNLVETVVCHFDDFDELLRAHFLAARANYRQTCVSLEDGVLNPAWEDNQKSLRLCGVGLTGYTAWRLHSLDWALHDLRLAAHEGADGMADELGFNHAALVTTIKPSGTASKVCGYTTQEVPEGVHKPLGKYIFNWIAFTTFDPMVPKLKEAGYRWMQHPRDPNGTLFCLPVKYENIEFDKATMFLRKEGAGVFTVNPQAGDLDEAVAGAVETYLYVTEDLVSPEVKVSYYHFNEGSSAAVKYSYRAPVECEVNLEPAVSQLERYKFLMDNYVDHNCSQTIYYDPSEKDAIVDWLMANWDTYVGVSFLYRTDPTKTAEDLGFDYLPQEVVDAETYETYVASLKPISFDEGDTNAFIADVDSSIDCATGACPIR